MKTVNPATGQPLKEYENHTREQIDARLARASDTFREWREVPRADRAARLTRAAEILRSKSETFGRIISDEMGKPLQAAQAEIEKCAVGCEYYAKHGEEFLSPQPLDSDASSSYVRYDPLGPVLAIMPWNFPFWQVFRFAAPSLMAGNVGLLKHAEIVTGCALAIEEVFSEAGFPEGCFTTLLVRSSSVADIIADDRIRAVTLTGSDAAGRAVASNAGEHLKKVVLELGGSDPFIVLADANLDDVAVKACKARTQNTGQSCIAAKRFIVEESIADEFEKRFVALMEELSCGDPLDEKTDLGPMARGDLRDELHDQVKRTVDAGATLLTGGEIPDGQGYYYPPTVLTGVTPDMPAFEEETFGPVAAVTRCSNADEAIELANRSRFGLGSSIWTTDTKRAEELAARIESGAVFINQIVASDPRLPFGGIKDSGHGRELSRVGIHEFVNIKTVSVK